MTSLSNDTTLSFAKALHRLLKDDWKEHLLEGTPIPTFEEVREAIEHHILTYFNYDGNLPYNGFDVLMYFSIQNGMPSKQPPPEVARTMLRQQAALEEITRIWLEISGIVDRSHTTH